MRDIPLSASGALTRDYINRAEKMRGIEAQIERSRRRSKWWRQFRVAALLVVWGLSAFGLLLAALSL